MIELLRTYDKITLEEMDGIKLMNRIDTKFVTTTERLYQLLALAHNAYRVQETDSRRVADYHTLYFDTDSMGMYLAHHNGRLNRQKLRIRSYVDSCQCFLEVKTKNNHGRTKKKRMAMSDFNPIARKEEILFGRNSENTQEYDGFITNHLHYGLSGLTERLENRFNRITLVNKGKTERITIDTDLRVHNIVTGKRMQLDNIAIIELKRNGRDASQILTMLRELRIKPMGFSKYCIGVAMTDSSAKTNRFKQRLHTIDRMMEEAQHTVI